MKKSYKNTVENEKKLLVYLKDTKPAYEKMHKIILYLKNAKSARNN